MPQRRIVLGVEETRACGRDVDRIAAPLEPHRAEIESALGGEGRSVAGALGQRQEHGVAQMRAGPRTCEHMGEKDPLVDLDAVLVALVQGRLGGNLLRRRSEAGDGGRRGKHQVLEPHHVAGGDLIINSLGMDGEEALAGRTRPGKHQGRRFRLGRVPTRLRRERGDQRRRPLPVAGVAMAVRGEVGRAGLLRGQPLRRGVGGQSGADEDRRRIVGNRDGEWRGAIHGLRILLRPSAGGR